MLELAKLSRSTISTVHHFVNDYDPVFSTQIIILTHYTHHHFKEIYYSSQKSDYSLALARMIISEFGSLPYAHKEKNLFFFSIKLCENFGVRHLFLVVDFISF